MTEKITVEMDVTTAMFTRQAISEALKWRARTFDENQRVVLSAVEYELTRLSDEARKPS